LPGKGQLNDFLTHFPFDKQGGPLNFKGCMVLHADLAGGVIGAVQGGRKKAVNMYIFPIFSKAFSLPFAELGKGVIFIVATLIRVALTLALG
jgi:hypothetical protein